MSPLTLQDSDNGRSADEHLLHLLFSVAEDLAQAPLDTILRSLVDRLREFFAADHACFHFLDDDQLRTETVQAALTYCPVRESEGADQEVVARVESVLNELALLRREPVSMSVVVQAEPHWNRIVKAAGIAGGLAIPLIHQNEPFGVVNLYYDTACPISTTDVAALRTLGSLTYGALQRELRLRALQEHEDVISALAEAIEAKDSPTGGHVGRVMHLAISLGKAVGLEGRDLQTLRQVAILHDLGKIGIPEAILNKAGSLTDEEFAEVRKHPEIGSRILSHLEGRRIKEVVAGVRAHHEWWDGTGYPDGLRGEEIPVAARIVAVVDTFDALTNDRPYRRAFSLPKALNILVAERGKHLDPSLVDRFVEGRLYEVEALSPA